MHPNEAEPGLAGLMQAHGRIFESAQACPESQHYVPMSRIDQNCIVDDLIFFEDEGINYKASTCLKDFEQGVQIRNIS